LIAIPRIALLGEGKRQDDQIDVDSCSIRRESGDFDRVCHHDSSRDLHLLRRHATLRLDARHVVDLIQRSSDLEALNRFMLRARCAISE